MVDSLNNLAILQNWLRGSELAGLIIPSTDEYLSVFAPPAGRRLRWATGFRGSMGLAVVLRDEAALFVDGRYLLQGAEDTGGAFAVEPATPAARRAWLARCLPKGACLGIDIRLHSQPDFAQWQRHAAAVGIELVPLAENPIDRLWTDRPPERRPRIVEYPLPFSGQSVEDKCSASVEHVRAKHYEALLVADPEDISWLLNVRLAKEAIQTTPEEPFVMPSCLSRALVQRDGRVRWFVDRARLADEIVSRKTAIVSIEPPQALAEALRAAATCGTVAADPLRTPATLTAIIEKHGTLEGDETVKSHRWRKHPKEVEGARSVQLIESQVLVRFMAWVQRTVRERRITEIEAANVLEALRAEQSECQASLPSLSASGESGALPHYLPRREDCRCLNDHPIYWMDSGGQYWGGTTDTTLTLALGTPEPKHILAHTLVLQGHIAVATARFPAGTSALRLDTLARMPLWAQGLDFNHNTGHGIGNFLNVHEGPYIGREPSPITLAPLEPGMIVTNEPGFYAAGDFGLRIERDMTVVESKHAGFLEFETISRVPMEPKLIDFNRLSPGEKQWLVSYHRAILQDLEPRLDSVSAVWLRNTVDEMLISCDA